MTYPLTVAELRKHLTDYPSGSSYDEALTRLLNAAKAAIDGVAGAVGSVTEYSDGGGPYIVLNRPASAFTTIKEAFGSSSVLTLATDDYQVSPSGYVLTRLTTGTNSRSRWHGRVQVVYTAADDAALREAVQLLLVQQFINYHPGLTAETIGSWSQTFAANSVYNWAIERESILSTLAQAPSMVVI